MTRPAGRDPEPLNRPGEGVARARSQKKKRSPCGRTICSHRGEPAGPFTTGGSGQEPALRRVKSPYYYCLPEASICAENVVSTDELGFDTILIQGLGGDLSAFYPL